MNPKSPHGGHNRDQPSPRAIGAGPVFELRRRMRLTRVRFASRVPCSPQAVREWEHAGTLPELPILRRRIEEMIACLDNPSVTAGGVIIE